MKFEHMWKDKSRDFPVLRGAWRLFHHVLRSCESSQEHTVAVLTRLDSASSGYLFRRVLFCLCLCFLFLSRGMSHRPLERIQVASSQRELWENKHV